MVTNQADTSIVEDVLPVASAKVLVIHMSHSLRADPTYVERVVVILHTAIEILGVAHYPGHLDEAFDNSGGIDGDGVSGVIVIASNRMREDADDIQPKRILVLVSARSGIRCVIGPNQLKFYYTEEGGVRKTEDIEGYRCLLRRGCTDAVGLKSHPLAR